MRYYWAHVRRFFHCLLSELQPRRGHRAMTDSGRSVTWIGCECGKTFWGKKDPELHKVWEAARKEVGW